MTMELEKDEAKLFNRQLKDEDLTEYRNIDKMKGRTDSGIDNAVIYQNDKVTQKLRDNLEPFNDHVTLPFDICNILKAEIDQKKKVRRIIS